MQTRCPRCETLYQIPEDSLREAAGKARCYRCDTVFDAYDQRTEDEPQNKEVDEISSDIAGLGLDDSDPLLDDDLGDSDQPKTDSSTPLFKDLDIFEEPDQATKAAWREEQIHNPEAESVPGPLLESDPEPDSAPAPEIRPEPEPLAARKPTSRPRARKPTPEPAKRPQANTSPPPAPTNTVDSQLEELFRHSVELDSEPYDPRLPIDIPDVLDDASHIQEPDSDELPFDVPRDLPELKPSDADALEMDAGDSPRKRSWGGRLLLTVAVIALSVLALGQWAWLQRDELAQNAFSRPIASLLCDTLGCTLPARRAPADFRVLSRDVKPSPEHDKALLMRILFTNDAGFAQPLPMLELSFLDSNGKLLARRAFHPREYLFPPPRKDRLVSPRERVVVDLLLEDPGTQATSFELDFR